jgi:hypothetical protein
MKTKMLSILLIALLISTSTFAKVQTNWGKMYDITKDNTNNDIPLPTADVTAYLNNYFQQIITDIATNQSSSNIYTVVFPVRDYIVSNTVTFSLTSYSSINNATINFIGLKISYGNGYFKNLSVVGQEAYINANYASTNIICNNDPSSSNYLNYQSKDPMPKFIYAPASLANVDMFIFKNSVNNITLANNACNIMGLEIQGEAFNNWSNLQPHPYFNTTNCKGLIDLAFWANAYVDNNYLHDHYGRGISTQLDPSSLFYRNKDVVISNNVVENVYAFLPGTLANGANDNCGDGINLMGIHGAIIKNNYVFNDLNITGMCGRLGIGGDAFQYCTIEGNVVNGYNRDIHIESGSGNNIIAKNRLTGTYCAILSSITVNPNPIIGNYMATKNIPNLTLNTWGGALGYTLDSALWWAYGSGLINYIPDNNLPLPIVGNTLYIDVNAGGNPNSTSSNYFYIHSNKDNIDLNCNEFKSNTGSFGLFIGGALHSLQSNSFNNIRPITINWSALNTTYNCNAPAAQINFTAIGGVAPINYSINGSAQSSPFIAASGSYTIVATDANSNTASTIVTITLPTPLALSIATTNVPCYNGNNGTAISTVTGSVSPYHYYWTDNTGNLISNQTIYDDAALHLTQGNYTLTVTDAIGCTATNSFSISQPAIQNAAIVTTSNSNLCQGGTGGTATVAVVPSNNSYTYSWSTTPVQTTATATNLAAGTYTATVTDGGYCAQTTITFTGIAITTIRFDVSCTTASDGSIQLTATGGTPGYTYNWSNAATTQNLTNLAAGNYSCIVTDANGCTATVNNLTINAPSGAYCCNTSFTNAPTHILADNINSSTLAQSTYSNTAIMVNGTFTIDNNFTLNNCQLYFTENALIQLSPNYTLTLNNCTLQAGCAVMWDGIYANDPTEQIVLNNCTISDMQQGLVLSNLAKLNITGNTFTDNYKCILFNNIVGAYNSTLGNCIVRKNIFTDDATKNLLPPYSTQSKTETAITIYWCSQVQIGYIDANTPDPSDKNVFENIYNGIFVITSNNATYSHKPLLYNNDFTNLHNDLIGTGVAQQNLNLLNNIFTTHRGAGIYVKDFSLAPQVLNDIHFITVNNNPTATIPAKFSNCDKAIVTTKMGADIRNTIVENTYFGFMHTEADGQKYLIGDQTNDGITEDANKLTGVHYGIDVNGMYSQVNINANEVNTKYYPMLTTLASVYPIGIKVDKMVNECFNEWSMQEGKYKTEIRQNTVNCNAAYGIGIDLNNTADQTSIDRNTVNLNMQNTEVKYGLFSLRDFIGINLNLVQQGTLLGNHVNGPSTSTPIQATDKNTTAIKLYASPNLRYECNHIQNTKYGWWLQDNCTTHAIDLVNNDWNHHYYGMLFTPMWTDGTLGDMGDGNDDYNFNFDGNYDNANYDNINDFVNNPAPDKMYRLVNPTSNTPPQPKVYSNAITPPESGSNIPGNEYIPFFTGTLIPPCDPTYSLVPSGGNNTGNGQASTLDQQAALQIANDSIAYYANPLVAAWLAHQRLYAQLDKDSLARENNLVLNNFYEERRYANAGYIYEANRAIARLINPESLTDPNQFANYLAEAKTANELNADGLPIEENERIINNLYFKTIELGSSSLDSTEVVIVENLAKSCPITNGSAVFKARSLWHTFEPWVQYNDLYICNSSSSNKNSTGGVYNFVLDNLENGANISSIIPPSNEFANVGIEIKKLNTNTPFSLLPNPAQSQITIKYQLQPWQSAKVIIYAAMGSEVQSINLPNFVETLTTSLNNISNGTYTYKYIVDGVTVTTNKLIVIN